MRASGASLPDEASLIRPPVNASSDLVIVDDKGLVSKGTGSLCSNEYIEGCRSVGELSCPIEDQSSTSYFRGVPISPNIGTFEGGPALKRLV